jgi:hypothetical protein
MSLLRSSTWVASMAGAIILLDLQTMCNRHARLSPLAELPPCVDLGTPTPDSWSTLSSASDSITIIAPSSFTPFDRGVEYMHGGAAWRSGEATLELSYGYWGSSSFPNQDKACKTVANGIPIIYMEHQVDSGFVLTAWYVLDEWSGALDPALDARSPHAEDLTTLRSILLSVRRPGAPSSR